MTAQTKRKFSKNAYLKGAARAKLFEQVYAKAKEDEPVRVIAARFRLCQSKIRDIIKCERRREFKHIIAPRIVAECLGRGDPASIPVDAAIGKRIADCWRIKDQHELARCTTIGELKVALEAYPAATILRILEFDFDRVCDVIQKHLGPLDFISRERFAQEAHQRMLGHKAANTVGQARFIDFMGGEDSFIDRWIPMRLSRTLEDTVRHVSTNPYGRGNFGYYGEDCPDELTALQARCDLWNRPPALAKLLETIHKEVVLCAQKRCLDEQAKEDRHQAEVAQAFRRATSKWRRLVPATVSKMFGT